MRIVDDEMCKFEPDINYSWISSADSSPSISSAHQVIINIVSEFEVCLLFMWPKINCKNIKRGRMQQQLCTNIYERASEIKRKTMSVIAKKKINFINNRIRR